MKKYIISLILILCVTIFSFGQSDTIPQSNDTIEVQDETLLLIQRADSARIADSLQKEILKKQLDELKSYEVSKRKELEQQLLELNKQDSLKRIAMKQEIDSLKNSAKGYPVIPYRDTVFLVFTKIGKITASERSEIIRERLEDLYKKFILKIDTLNVVDYGQTVDIIFKDKTIMSVTEYDAMWFGKTKYEIAENYKNLILKDIKFYKSNTNLFTLLKQIGLAVLVIVIQVIFIRLINLLFKKKIDTYLVGQKGKRFKGIKIKDYQFLDEERMLNVVLFISKILRWFVNIVQLYITIPILFSIFPPTQRLAETLFGYVLEPLKKFGLAILHYLPNLFAIIVIVFLTRQLVKFLKFISEEIGNENLKIQGFYPDWAKPTFNIVRFLVLAFMFVMIFPYLPGSDSPVFQGVSVFIGVIFSLGSSSIIGNMIAGLVMTYMRPFQIGDRIKVGDVTGDVVERTAFVTRIKTTKNEFITVPNSNILSSSVTNYSTSRKIEGIILHTTVTIGYDVPWKLVHKILIDAAERTNLILKKPEPFVLQTSLDDFYVSYQLNAYTGEPNKQAGIYSELHQNIQDVFFENNVEILSPHYRAARDGNMTTIPENYLPKDYKIPSFRVENTEYLDKK